MNFDAQQENVLLFALGEQLRELDARFELVVVGGAALLALGLVDRTTSDIDVLAVASNGGLNPANPLPAPLVEARDRVARDFNLGPDWLNPGPSDLLQFGLPDGFTERVSARSFGSALTVHFAGRFDQIHFKLYALVDHGAGRHEDDLRALRPTEQELLAAARWTRTHDPSESFRQELLGALEHLGVEDADLGA
ncbi:MAG: DUF6036 family nucleotidyltransferase [Actinomycetota bacterium]|nr:DUF6036 family nucleotidyltransferase [Actinomycetota bacterium]